VEAETNELSADGAPQIDECLVARGSLDHPLVRARREHDAIGDVSTNLEAARSDARSDGSEETSRRTCVRSAGEVGRSTNDDACFDASPTGMDRRDAPACRIREQKWNAIGDAHEHGVPRLRLGHEGIRFECERRDRVAADHDETLAMNLRRLMDVCEVDTDRGRQPRLVLDQTLAERVTGYGKIEAIKRRRADATMARRESVVEAGCRQER
jgi:hypothetical protein